MGCDIHPILERKFRFDDGSEKWVGLHSFEFTMAYARKTVDGVSIMAPNGYCSRPAFDHRNYLRFAALAGVRGDGPEPKGLPEDASDLARMETEKYGSDGHSHSWCSLKEALEICLATESDSATVFFHEEDARKKDPFGYYFGLAYYGDEDDKDNSLDNYRLVFYFDN